MHHLALVCIALVLYTVSIILVERQCQPYVQYNGNITNGPIGVAKYHERVQITCDWGYEFPDGSNSKWTRCGPEFHWSPYLPLCGRKNV